MTRKLRALGLCLLSLWVAGLASGCFGDRSIAGGTQGILRSASGTLRDVRIDVYVSDSTDPVGFGVTGDGGQFQLYQPDAKEPLYLEPGDYSFTLESVGPEPIGFRSQFNHPQRTPLRKKWEATEATLDLVIP